MPPSSRKGKKKAKSKQNTRKSVITTNDGSHQNQLYNQHQIQNEHHHHPSHGFVGTEIYDEESDYPSSRVIKRAPNGDVVVESLPDKQQQKKSQHQQQYQQHQQNEFEDSSRQQSPMAFTLDSHWESLTPEEKKNILRIEKDEVFEVIRKYQNNHSCNCSVCGRRHMAMDQEMERIYNTLYELDKDRDPEINPIKFHLSIIKELQDSKAQQQQQQQQHQLQLQQQKLQQQQLHHQQLQEPEVRGLRDGNLQENRAKSDYENMRDEVVKFFLSSNAVDSLKEEVMHFKQNKQKQQQHQHQSQQRPQQQHDQKHQYHNHSHKVPQHKQQHHSSPDTNHQPQINRTELVSNFSEPPLGGGMEKDLGLPTPPTDIQSKDPVDGFDLPSGIDSDALQGKYLNFAKTFVSSHPKIAQEYVNRMMMYPDMRALTDDLMNNNGQGFIQAVEGFVLNQQQHQQLHQQSQQNLNQSDQQTDLQLQSLNGYNSIDLSRYQHLSDAREFTTMLHNGEPLTGEEYFNLQRHIAERMTNSYDTQKKEFKEVSQLERELFIRFMFGEDRKRFGDLIMESFKEKCSEDYGAAAIGASLAAAAAATSASIKIPGNDDTDADYDYDDQEENDGIMDSGEYDERFDDYSDYDQYEDNEFDEDEYELKSEINNEDGDRLTPEYKHVHGTCTHDRHDHEENVGHPTHHHHHHHHFSEHHPHNRQNGREEYEDEEEEDEEDEEDEEYDSGLDETDRLEEGRKLIQIAITKLLQGRIMESYHEKQAENNRLKLLQELEAEEQKKKAKEEKKQKKREKEKERKRQLQQAREEEVRRKEEEAETARKEAEERENQRREAQRKKVEDSKRKKDEERKRMLEEQRKREEEQERQRKLKEEQKRKKDEEKRLKEEEKKHREAEKRKKDAQKKKEQQAKFVEERKEKEEREAAEYETQKEERQRDHKNFSKVFPMDKSVGISEDSVAYDKTNILSNTGTPNLLHENVYGYMQQSNVAMDKSVNDDIFGLVNSANVQSNPTHSSVSEMQKLLRVDSGVSDQDVQNKQIFNPTSSSIFGGTHALSSFDPLSNMSNQLGANKGSSSAILGGQPYEFNTWNGFLGPNLAGDHPVDFSGSLQHHQNPSQSHHQQHVHMPHQQHQASQQPTQKPLQQVPIIPPLELGRNEVSNDKTFEEEMNSLTDMLTSAGLRDHRSSVPNSYGQTPLWIGNTQGSMDIAGNSVVPGTSNPMGDTTASTAAPRTSIWEIPSMPRHDIGMLNNGGVNSSTPSSFATSSIWGNNGPSNVSFLDGSTSNTTTNDNHVRNGHDLNSVAPSPTTVPSAVPVPPASTCNNFVIDNIYETYSTFVVAQDPSLHDKYIPTSLVHQNSIACNVDYGLFITYLFSMRTSHGCEFLTDESGNITHVKMFLGLSQDSPQGQQQFHNSLQNKIYQPQTSDTTSLMSTPLVQTENLPPNQALNSGINPNPQLYNIRQRVNPSLVSNIWG